MLTQAQREKRKKGIGGSDAAAIAGVSKWGTAYSVYLNKVSEEDTFDDSEKEYLYFGSLLEPMVANEYERRTKRKVEVLTETVQHKKFPWMLGNLDRLIVGEKGALECKVAMYNLSGFGEEGSDEIPTEYLIQCAHYAAVKDLDYVDLAVFAPFSNSLFRIYTYKRNLKLENNLIELEQNFWCNHVEKRIPPDPQNTQEASHVWQEDKDKILLADDNDKVNLAVLVEIKEKIKILEKQKDITELAIKNKIREASAIADEYGKILATWKTQPLNRFDINAFKEADADNYQKFIKSSITRVLRLKGNT